MPAADKDARTEKRQQRSYYRVLTRIPIRIRRLDPSEVPSVSMLIANPVDPFVEVSDPALAVVLQRVENKLDVVLSHLEPGHPRPLGDRDIQKVSLSASGVGCEMNEQLSLHDDVLVEFLLPEAPARHVRAIARPVMPGDLADGVRGTPQAFAFHVISDADRDAIVHYSYDVQRLQLRECAQAKSSE
jgi:hypothetical protein